MTDYLNDLTVSNTFIDLAIDYATSPTLTREYSVISNIYSGTIHSNWYYTQPIDKIGVKVYDDTTGLYAFLVSFADRIGRYKSFWMPEPFKRFKVTAIDPLKLFLDVEKVADLNFNGYERIWIRLKNGDRITRLITSITQASTYTRINFISELPDILVDPNTLITDIIECSYAILARFDQDEVNIDYVTNKIASVNLSFVELKKEYTVL